MTHHGAGDRADATLREFSAGQKVFDRYRLKKILGRGGMGIVWLARDEELEREVALKFLPDLVVFDKALLVDLKRETRRSLELTHKNIVRIYDFVQSESSACISMEYIDGDTLSNLRAEKDAKVFQPEEIAVWTSQLCDALDYAHNHARIIHRDLKPANLMVNQKGDLKVSDFGIARSLGDSMSKLTMASGTSGTLVYMSPQQLDGERGTHLDDIYSLGATIYDLLTGKPPFYSGNIDRQIHERTAPSMTERRKEFNLEPALVPPIWEAAVAACLAKDPAQRPQSAAEVAIRLQLALPQTRPVRTRATWPHKKIGITAGLTAACLLAIAGWYFTKSKPRVQPAASLSSPSASQATAVSEQSIAVLPFENLSAEKEDAFFADGIHDDVLTTLGKVKELTVIARASVMSYRGAALSGKLREIGKTLGVSHVLEGSVRRSASQVVLNVRLIDTRDEHQVWSERYDRTLTDSLGLQGELATEIAHALRARLEPEETARLATRPTNNPEAYVLYLKARDKENTAASQEDRVAIDKLYDQAVALDPRFAVAMAGQSMLNSGMYYASRSQEWKIKAYALATEALRLAPDLPEAHLALGLWFRLAERNYDAALKEFSIAAQTMSNDPELLGHLGALYRRQGRWREALAKFQRAKQLDPRVANWNTELATTHFFLRDWQAAAAAYRRVLEIEPNDVGTLMSLAHVAMFGEGDLAAARAFLQKLPPTRDASGRRTDDDIPTRWELCMQERDFAAAQKVLDESPGEFSGPGEGFKTVCLAWTALARGDTAASRTLLEKVRPIFEANAQSHPDEPVFNVNLGILYAYLGRKEDALRESRRAVELRPANKDAIEGPAYLRVLAWVCAVTGETEEAITLLEHLLTTPVVYLGPLPGVTLADLRLSWKWDGLRENVRFQKILEGPEPKTIY